MVVFDVVDHGIEINGVLSTSFRDD
jgi:hypothetical protein